MISIKKKDLFNDVRQMFSDLKHLDQSIVDRSEESEKKVGKTPVKKSEYQLRGSTVDSLIERENAKKNKR